MPFTYVNYTSNVNNAYILVQQLTENFIVKKLKLNRVTLFEKNISFVGFSVKGEEIHLSVCMNGDGTYDVLSVKYRQEHPNMELLCFNLGFPEVKRTLLQHKLKLAVARCVTTKG